ncbi:unnamed protein product [Hermetia illucens]|uniref:Tudor domain-containing protein n=1 Tax=Hermetia illucens TaxID=343691 RepID=A0A7R8UC49_HERIL|nr:maternal protein tudor isoform X3 [Hermetia illucens]CAD7078047.1 unnamed protein product [Hermetia illucens]
MLVTHVQAVGPFLRVFGQLDGERTQEIQAAINSVIALISQTNPSPVPKLAELPVETICLARFMGKQFKRARIIGHRGPNEVFVQFIDYGNEFNVKIHEIRLLNFQSREVEIIQTMPTQATPFILTGIYCQWTPQQMNELNADLGGQLVTALTDAKFSILQLGTFTFITIIWRNENLVNYLVHIKKFGTLISLEEQTNTFYTILTKSRGLVPVRQLHSAIPPPQVNLTPISCPIPPPISIPHTMTSPIIQAPQVIRMPYKKVVSPNRRNDISTLSSPPKRSVVTFKSNTLMVSNFYDVYCCFVENGPCVFSVHLKSTTEELNEMMNEIESIPLSNLSERPSIGMACIARYSEDNHLYRAVIMTIKPTSCQVAYVDYGNTENVPFADLYEIPTSLLDQKIFAIRFALSGYKELEPLDDSLKNAFKDMVLHKDLRLKVMPLEGPPLVQYCELYDGNINILEALKKYKNRKLSYSSPPPLNNNDVVVIRYVESPKKFFIQKVDSIRAFEQMMDDLFLYCKKRSTPLQKFTKGSACAVKFENAWYRAEILGMNQNRIHIRHVDFGNERNVEPGQLSAISERLVKFPIQATKCCLKGFENTESLSESATVQLEMLAENENNERRHFKCQIYQIQEDGTILVNLIDEKMRPELNLMKRLYKLSMPFNKYIGLEKEEYPYQQNLPAMKPVPDFITTPLIYNSTSSNGEEPGTTNQLNTDWDVRSSHSAASSDSKDRSSPSDYQRDNRRQNHHSPNSQRQFKDNSNKRESPYTTFKGKNSNLPPRFQKQQEENRKFKENRLSNSYDQKHYNSSSDSYKSPSPILQQQVMPQSMTGDSEWETEPQKLLTSSKVSSSPLITTREEYVSLKYTYPRSDLIVPSREEVILCWWVSPHQFYTHNCTNVSKFEILMRDIQIFYKNKPPATNQSFEVGSSIIARYHKDQVLYRALILAHNEALQKYRVEFVDFGNQATITPNDIWLLEKRFSEFPIMAQLCGFENVVSNFEHRQITSQVEKYLKPELKLFCNYQRKENNMCYADIEVNGRSLRDLLVQDGSLSVVEPNLSLEMLSGQQIRIKIVSIKDLLNFQIEIEGCNLKLMSSYNDIKFVKSNAHLSTEFKSNYEGKCCIADVIDVSKEKILMLQPIIPLFINDISKKICEYPVVYREFDVKVAFIETENIIYVHPTVVEEKLGEMLDAMYNFYSTQGLPLKHYNVGTLVAALSSDGNWYRAKIVSFDSNNFSAEVYYLDYGNIELIENKDNIRELDQQFYECSALAIRFYFPIKSNKANDTAVDTIKSLTENYVLTLSIVERYQGCWIADIQSNSHSLINVLKNDYSLTNGIDIEHAKNIIDNDTSVEIIPQSPDISNKTQSFEAEPVTAVSSVTEVGNTASGIVTTNERNEVPEVPNDMTAGYLSHCDNPGRFFLHLASTYPELQQLQDNIQIVAGSLPPLMTSVTGALCIALYTVDETWYRAKIIDSEIMAVQFIDYGNTDVLTDSSYVKEMNEAFAGIPPFAIPCALPISPRNTTDWVDEANNIFNEAYDKTVYFSYITQNPKKNYVNLKIDGLNIAEKLIADGLARKLEVLKSGENGFVSHINSLSDFYIQMESYADGLELIAGHLSDYENFNVLTDNSVGNVCAAIFPEDNCWYRAKILSHTPDGTEVLFIDYGNTAITSELREISTEIANLPFLSKKCSLRMPDHILGWSDEAEAMFHELSAMGETVFVVELIEPSDHAIIDLYIGKRNILEDLEPLCDKRPNIEMDLNSSMGKDDFALHESIHEPKLEEVGISHVSSPTDFYVHLLSEKDKLDQVLEALNCGELGEPIPKPEIGMICSALFSDDGAFYRAEVLSIDEKEGSKVIFIDYGNTTTSKELYALPKNLNTIPALAYQCTLDPHGPLDLESKSTVGRFQQVTNELAEDILKIDIINRSVRPWVVSLQCNGLNIYDELERLHTTENREEISSNSESIAKGIVGDVIENAVSEIQVCHEMVEKVVDDAMNSILDGKQPLKGDMNQSKIDQEDVTMISSSNMDSSHDKGKKVSDDFESTVGSSNFALNEKTATTDVNSKSGVILNVTVTQAYDVHDFYIRLCSDEGNLQDIQAQLQKCSTLEKFEKPEVGCICAALDPEQNIYNRARVISIQQNGEYQVELIDSGIRFCTKDLHSLPDDLKKAPALAKRCALKNIDKSQLEKSKLFKHFIESNSTKKYQMTVFDVSRDVWIVSLSSNDVDVQDELEAIGIVHEVIDASVEEMFKDAVVSHTNSPNDFYIQLSADVKNLEQITERLYSAVNFEKISDPNVGMLCAALFPDDGAFYRAQILSISDDSSFEVLFIDFGNVSISDDIRLLPDDLGKIECIAKQCALENTSEIDFWSQEAYEAFSALVASHLGETFQIEVKSNTNSPWIVKLFYQSSDLHDDLKKLMQEQQTLGINDSSDVWEEAKDSSGAIIANEIIENLIDRLALPNGDGSKESTESIANDANLNDTSNSEMSASSALTCDQLAQQLWDGLHKLGITDSNLLQRSSSASNLCDNKLSKTSNSVTALLSEQSDPTRSKSVECFIDNN